MASELLERMHANKSGVFPVGCREKPEDAVICVVSVDRIIDSQSYWGLEARRRYGRRVRIRDDGGETEFGD